MSIDGLAGAIIVASLLATSPAYADWHYTHWDMSPDQVIAASDSQAVSTTASEKSRFWIPDTGQHALVRAPYQIGGKVASEALFYFTEDSKLERVSLRVDISHEKSAEESKATFDFIYGYLTKDYGPAKDARGDALFYGSTWNGEEGEKVTLTIIVHDDITLNFFASQTPVRLGDLFGMRAAWIGMCEPNLQDELAKAWNAFMSHAPDSASAAAVGAAYISANHRTWLAAADPKYKMQNCIMGAAVNPRGIKGWREQLATYTWPVVGNK